MQKPNKLYDHNTTLELKELLNNHQPSDSLPVEKIKTLVRQNANPNIKAEAGFYVGCTWMHALIPEPFIFPDKRRLLNLISFLAEAGADSDIQDNQKQTVLLRAIVKSFYPAAVLLYKYTSDTNIPDENGNNLLHQLIYRGEVESVEFWLTLGVRECNPQKSVLKSLKSPNKKNQLPTDVIPLKNQQAMCEILKQYRPQKNL